MTFNFIRPNRRDFLRGVLGGSALVQKTRADSPVAERAGPELMGYVLPRVPEWDEPELLLVGIGAGGIRAVERIRTAWNGACCLGVSFVHGVSYAADHPRASRRGTVRSFRNLLGRVAQVCLFLELQDKHALRWLAPEAARLARASGAHLVAIIEDAASGVPNRVNCLSHPGLADLLSTADAALIVPRGCSHVLGVSGKLREATGSAPDWSLEALQGLVCNRMCSGIVSPDLPDCRRFYRDGELIRMGIGIARGPHRAEEAIRDAFSGSCLDGSSMKDASAVYSIVFGIPSPEEIGSLVHEVCDTVHPLAHVHIGNPMCPRTLDLGDWLQVTLLARGLDL